MAVEPSVLLARARDHTTPGAELAQIANALLASRRARADDPPDRRAALAAVASNPNTPPGLLLSLADDHPEEVSANPVLPLLLLEDPALFTSAPVNGLCRLLAQPATPRDWFALAARHANHHVRRAVAASRWAPGDVLLRLLDDGSEWVILTLAANPATPPAALVSLGRSALADTKAVRQRVFLFRALAANPATPLDLLESLAEDPALLTDVASNSALPAPLVEELASHEAPEVRAALAARADLPPRLVRRFAADAHPSVRAALARHAADPALLTRLALAPEGLVRRALIDNPHTPSFALERLAHAPVGRHRAAARGRLAKQARTPGSP
jgi:hypothetical protein